MDRKLLETSEREFEALVEREFEALRLLPDDEVEAPITGDIFDPHDPEQFERCKQRALQALACGVWWTSEMPPWAGPLPIKPQDISALRNQRGLSQQGHRRALLVADYAERLRGSWWRPQNVVPFEIFCAQALGG